jgi:hypothetical protein
MAELCISCNTLSLHCPLDPMYNLCLYLRIPPLNLMKMVALLLDYPVIPLAILEQIGHLHNC